jgi:hypothetical protein
MFTSIFSSHVQALQSIDKDHQYVCGVNAVCGHVDGLDNGTITVEAKGINGLDANYSFANNISNGNFVLPLLSAKDGQQYTIATTYAVVSNKANVCQVSGNPYTFGSANNIKIDCGINTGYTIGGQIAGLITGEKLVIKTVQSGNIQNGGTFYDNGDFTLSMPVPDNTSYSATTAYTQTPPAERNCIITGGKGQVKESNVTNILIDCNTKFIK